MPWDLLWFRSSEVSGHPDLPPTVVAARGRDPELVQDGDRFSYGVQNGAKTGNLGLLLHPSQHTKQCLLLAVILILDCVQWRLIYHQFNMTFIIRKTQPFISKQDWAIKNAVFASYSTLFGVNATLHTTNMSYAVPFLMTY